MVSIRNVYLVEHIHMQFFFFFLIRNLKSVDIQMNSTVFTCYLLHVSVRFGIYIFLVDRSPLIAIVNSNSLQLCIILRLYSFGYIQIVRFDKENLLLKQFQYF